jgi:hypothetical protein
MYMRLCFFISMALLSIAAVADDCVFIKDGKLIPLKGKVQIVEHFPDIKVQIVEHFPDIEVKLVEHFPDDCGEVQIVEHFPDIKVQIVEHFPDIKVRIVKFFPGVTADYKNKVKSKK